MTTIKANQNTWKLPYEYVCWKNLLVDIDYDTQNLEQILEEQIIPQKVDDSVISELSKMKISTHWFLDYQYSDEYEKVLNELKDGNLDEIVKNNLDKVFYEEEKNEWVQKLITAAYIKFSIGKDTEAGLIYGITKDEAILTELLKNILMRSIYEYLIVIKYDKSVSSFGLEINEIEEKIKYIEEKWVNNV